MSLLARLSFMSVLASIAMLGAVSCGTTSNNDQGTSFLALGYYILSDSTDPQSEVIPSTLAFAEFGSDTATLFGLDGDALVLRLGLQNRLSTQFIRIQRVDCHYEVQGSDPNLVIPDEAFPMSFLLGPTATDTTSSSSSSSGTTGTTLPQVIFMPVDIISTDIFSFLTVNQNLLPARPFDMTVTCSAVGISQAGDVFTTNEVSYRVVMSDAAECCTGTPTPGFQGGTGNGGTISSSSSSGSSSSTAVATNSEDSSSSSSSE